MKNTYKRLSVLFGGLLAVTMHGQLAGTYSVNSAVVTGGSNFQSFTALATALNAVGVTGPVTVHVVPGTGPYNEQVTFNQITGASASNSILINGNNNLLTFSSSNSAQPWTILMNGADYFTVKDLTVSALGTFGFGAVFTGGADYNTFNNVNINCPANTTSANHIPIVLSGSSSVYYTVANSGNYNTFTGCTMFSGYYSVVHYGLTGPQYNTNNTFQNCKFRDWHILGMYSSYGKNLTVTGCDLDRPTHTTAGSPLYGLYLTYNQGAMINGNRLHNFWGGSPGYATGGYGISISNNPVSGTGVHQNRVQNNVISEMNNNAYVYGIYSNSQNGFIEHNTIILDNANNFYTGASYGMRVQGTSASYPLTAANNLVYFGMPGASTSTGIYYGSTTGLTSDHNNYYMNNGAGTQYPIHYNTNHSTLASAQVAGTDANSKALDPQFINPAGGVYIPMSHALNNSGTPVSVTADINNVPRNVTTPDIGALEFLTTVCTGAPAAGTVIAPSYSYCTGSTQFLSIAPIYSLSGFTFTWQSSTTSSNTGFSTIGSATQQIITTPTLGQSTWFRPLITCTNTGQTTTVQPAQALIAVTTTVTVPYTEGIENIPSTNWLPNCSWAASNLSTTCVTYTSSGTANRIPHTGNKFASFYYDPPGQNYFYTQGIFLNAGVTYSTGLWYITENTSFTNWTDLSILIGTAQSTVGQSTIVTNGGAAAPTYQLLSGTFSVSSPGLYYIAIRATPGTVDPAFYLSWDDFFITAPCSLNTPTISVNSSTNTVCSGSVVTYTVSGAATYSWNNGASTAVVTVTPPSSTSYSVYGTSTTGCVSSSTVVLPVTVNITPTLGVNSATICTGNSVAIVPTGASTYTITGNNFTVSPLTNTVYSVTGKSAAGCVASNTAVASISVNITPTVGVNSGTMCSGKSFTVIPSGASTYTITGNNFTVTPTANASYSVTGTGTNGCIASNTAVVGVTVHTTPTVTASNPTVCSGNTVAIIPGGASSYSITGNAFTVTPLTNTSYSVTGSSTAGCVSNNTAVSAVTVYITPTLSVNSPTLCTGKSATIIPTGANTYSITGNNFTVSPSVNTTYSVTGTSVNGCAASNTAIATVTAYITPTLGVNSATICSGMSVVITPNGAATYSITGNAFTVTPLSNTSYSVTGTSTAGCLANNTAVASVSVNTSPTVTVNSGSICSGNSFSIIPSGGATYTVTGNSYTVSPTVTTAYSVTGSAANGCVSGIAIVNVSVSTTPTITANNATICAGDMQVITPIGAASYTITGNSFTVTPATTTSYSITGSSNGCPASNTFVSTVLVHALPTVTVTSASYTVCAGQSVILSAGGASTYAWSDGQTGMSISIAPTATTSYTVVGTDANGCDNSASLTQITDPCVGLREVSAGKLSIKVYPNPNAGEFMVESPKGATITVTNLLGEVVGVQTADSSATRVSIRDLAAGAYFVNVRTDKGNEVVKVVKGE